MSSTGTTGSLSATHLCVRWLALAIVLLAPVTALADAARIVSVAGLVEIQRSGASAWSRAAPGTVLDAGDLVRTGTAGRVAIVMADESLLKLNRNSRFRLKEVSRRAGWFGLRGLIPVAAAKVKSLYELVRGELWMLNKNRDIAIDIDTPNVTTGIRGTELNLKVADDGSVTVSVLEGAVQVSNALGAVSAGASEEVFAAPGAAPVKRLLARPEDAVQWIVTVPALFGYRDFPLVSGDRERLLAERERLENAVARSASASSDRLALAGVLRDLGQTREALAGFDAVLRSDPGNAIARAGRGWCLLDLSRPDDGLAAFAGLTTRSADLGRPAALLSLGRPADAARAIRDGLARHPGDGDLEVLAALAALDSGRLDDAASMLERAVTATPSNALAWRLLALVSVLVDDKALADEAARRALELAPGAPSARLIHAYTRQARFDLPGAEASVRHALRLDPGNVTALTNLAELEFGSGRTEDARGTIAEAARVAPNDARVATLEGFVALAARRQDAARGAFMRAIAADTQAADPWLGMSLVHMRDADVADAMEAMAAAVVLEPRRAMFYTYWGKMLYQVGRHDKALDMFERASELDPNDPAPHFHRSVALRDLNRSGESVRALNTAVSLNDNTAIYRSRFLLDQDLATKNVDQSILYSKLGLEAWAERKALAGLKSDYTNFAAHLFYAGSLEERDGRDFSFLSETLLARMLQPANNNTFNNFNQYTSFFEEPDLGATVTGKLGEQKTREAEALAFGSVPELGLAVQGGAFYEHTDGWRGSNFERFRDAAAIVKWEPTERDGFLLTTSWGKLREGDRPYPRYEYDVPSRPDDRSESVVGRFELGYQHTFEPGIDLLAYGSRITNHGQVYEFTETPVLGLGAPASFSSGDQTWFQRPLTQGQVQLNARAGDHQIDLGFLGYWGDRGVDTQTDLFFNFGGTSFYLPPPFSTRTSNTLDVKFTSVYVQDTWRVTPSLSFEAALYFDQMQNANAVAGTEWTEQGVHPRGGLIWQPTGQDTFRVAAFKTLLPFASGRLDPTEVAGIGVFRNAAEGSVSREFAAAYEHEWASGLFAVTGFHVNKTFRDEVVIGGAQVERKRSGRRDGVEAELNWLIGNRVGLAAVYRYEDVTDATNTVADRKDHLARLRLRYVDPRGWTLGASQIYRNTDRRNGLDDDSLWSTDLEARYEMRNKRAEFRLEVHNLFDNGYNWVTDRFTLQGEEPARRILGTVVVNF